ncbi:4'-phosphopantetheinyl transferase superfamily protein [Microbulbifer salipaludis]|uniref:Enterobactin synthase component D n=1 Tax=Microbulbifer salipaludis TaxID=187980 RepID=A0ABS3E3W2_9GAMM|nr:4'-phosphopantetheinyl transferase superfamily protein [Microbulbifer salipaludis]MBN8429995.1 4'-phosphopantetheinyl transferase superfamily protein [Microbulbifer salipaludis]
MMRETGGFIGEVCTEMAPASGVRVVRCAFDSDRYQPGLFTELRIAMPESIARSVPKRQAEFLAGRYAAALALQYLSPAAIGSTQVGIGERRNPLWPNGVVGSISHTDVVAVCAVGLRTGLDYLGIDREALMSARVCDEVAPVVSSRPERERLCAGGLSEQAATTLIFSAKESLFKALYPLVRDYFGFEVAEATALCLEEQILVLRLSESFASKYHLPREYRCQFTLGEHWIQSLTCGKLLGRARAGVSG